MSYETLTIPEGSTGTGNEGMAYSSAIPRTGDRAIWVIQCISYRSGSGDTCTAQIEHKNLEDTTFSNLSSDGSATINGTGRFKIVTGSTDRLKEIVRLKFSNVHDEEIMVEIIPPVFFDNQG